jgi:hypothetical protein
MPDPTKPIVVDAAPDGPGEPPRPAEPSYLESLLADLRPAPQATAPRPAPKIICKGTGTFTPPPG